MPPKPPGSFSSGAPSSDGASSAASHESMGILGRDGDGETDLLRGNSSSKKETLFGVLFFIYSNRWLPTDWRYVGLAVILQWAQLFLIVFGPGQAWDIDWQGNRFWRFYVRLQLQNAITQRGYKTYEAVLFGGTALVLFLLAVVLWLHFALRTKTRFRWQWPAHLLRIVVCIAFTTLQTSYLLLFTVAFNCNAKALGFTNYYFPDRKCFAMPHTALFGLSIFMALLFTALSALFALIETGASEPLSRNYLSLSNGSHFFIRRLIKFALPLMPVALKTVPKWEGWALFLLASYFLYITIRRVPFHRAYLNIGEAFLYSWCWLAAGLAVLGTYYPQYWPVLTTAFLAGMGPVGLAFGGLCWWRLNRIWAVAMSFERWTSQTPRREVHRFQDQEEAEVVARVAHQLMRTPTLDWVPIPLWVTCAGNVLRAAQVQFPDSAFLNISLGTFEAVLCQEPSGGLTYLQKACKCSITMAERFQCYVREQEKLAKKSKDSDASAILDATSWAEYQASYRAVIRAHRGALSALKAFWALLLHSDVSMTSLQRHFGRIEKARGVAERSYKAVMERYPNNPRIMRAYARFLQQVKNDPHGSTRYANSASRIEAKQNELRSETMFSQLLASAAQPGMDFISTMFSSPARAHLLYGRDQCLSTTCYTPNDTPYYTMNMGMDSYLVYAAEQAHTLSKEAIENITVFHPAARWIQATNKYGGTNLLAESNKIFMIISNFVLTKIAQGVALGVSIAGAVAYLYFLARPYFAVTLAESRKVAELLSYLPLVDVGALMASAAGRGGGDGTSALQRTSSRSSDGETD